MRTGLNAIVVLAVLGMAGIAAAQTGDLPLSLLGRHRLACPVCEQVFTALVVTHTNARGGVDRDLFARAVGPEPEYYRISTCPNCGYSGYLSDFAPDVVLPPDLRQRILKSPRLELPAGFTPDSDPRELDASDRYRLAIQCYRWGQKSDEAIGWLHLRASWIARDEGAMLPKDPRLARVMEYLERYRPELSDAGGNQRSVEMQMVSRALEALAIGQFNRYQKPYVELAVALILRRHGENRQAGPMLDRLIEYKSFSESLRQGIARMRESIQREREHQAEAVTCFERALLAGQVARANRGVACYLVGELCRRLGRDREAVRWYDEALRDASLPAEVRTWASEQRGEIALAR
ncbi:MAG TPA: DUF2225 domain-containing protein [Phycisphaerae bacterium]|nr:DUF2225 domain-containing protein [Phycisphaerae bacterium]HOJ73695.1 DUF2225 domain-containing protein [Phycisphaerae bacterium]HOM50342.1 DUF2225 domain-containing protein [Phycisphaerae bacterium]HON67667.1 DUF2225 domain-containing protein [Phycisphaerae bacterium]HOQ84969.1 DUF2225 domain-containing protein [Phycisphaerae bacterium]